MVEWKKLEDFGNYFGGLTGKTKEDFVEGNAKFITYMNVFANPALDVSTTGVVRINEGEKQNKIQKGDILFTGSSETPDEAGMSCVVTDDLNEDYYMNSFCFGIRLNQPEQYKLGYLKHILRSSSIRKEIAKSASGVTRFNISKARFGKILIPLPSLSEQERIVGILDTFTSSIENLKAQISLRRKQYEHYRDKLLDLEGKPGVEMKTLGEICNFIRGPFGGALKKEIFVNEGYAIYEQQHAIYGEWSFRYFIDEKKFSEMKRFEVKPGDILMSCSGTMGKTSIVPSNCIKGIINQALLKLTTRDILDNKFLKKYMDSQWFQDGLKKQVAGGAIQNVASVSILKDLIIPLPSPKEQSRIVSILDEFEASIKNLEAQLEAREKQYEYYREKLLTFERE